MKPIEEMTLKELEEAGSPIAKRVQLAGQGVIKLSEKEQAEIKAFSLRWEKRFAELLKEKEQAK